MFVFERLATVGLLRSHPDDLLIERKMNRMFIIVISLLSVFIGTGVSGAPKGDEKKIIHQLESSYVKTKTKVLDNELRQRKILSSLFKINKNMKKMSAKRDRLTNLMLSTQGNVKDLAKSVVALDEKIKTQQKQLSYRLRTIYKMGVQGQMQIIFSSTNSHDFDRNLKFLNLISKNDYELIKQYKKNLARIVKKRKDMKKEVTHLLTLKKKFHKQEKYFEKEQISKSQLLSSLKLKKKKDLASLKQLKQDTLELADSLNLSEINKIIESNFFEQKGKLLTPVEGRLIKSYGLLQNEEYKYRLSHKGNFYAAAYGQKVKSVHKGEVSFVGRVQGYGKVVVLDHGDHYYTVYGHNSKIKVYPGDKVKSGDVIAEVGKSSDEFGVGLYFEIRHFSDAVDPQLWLSKAEVKKLKNL